MSYLSEKDAETLERMVEVSRKIQVFAQPVAGWEELAGDELRLDAILMNFINLGECVTRLSQDMIANTPSVEWQKIKGMRNIVAHDYWGVDVEMVWQIIQHWLPNLSDNIARLLK
jgi:uncharacterized protein with HEPN domain